MGAGSRAALVILRIWQLICAVIVLGILARFVHFVVDAGVTRDGRVIYGLVVASLSILFAVLFIAPFMYSFMAFPADFAFFVMWLILFCLLITVSGRQPTAPLIPLTNCVHVQLRGHNNEFHTRLADRYPHMQLPLVYQLLGLLLGRVVVEKAFLGPTRVVHPFRVQFLADCSGVLVHGHGQLSGHHMLGTSAPPFSCDRPSCLTVMTGREPTLCLGAGPKKERAAGLATRSKSCMHI